MALLELCGMSSERTTFLDDKELKDEFESAMLSGNFANSNKLLMPPMPIVSSGLSSYIEDETGRKLKLNYNHGTTTLAFRFQGGVLLAVDSRATGGQYIGSQSVRKILHISDHLLGTMAGGAADCVYWLRVLAKEVGLYELRNRQKMSVAAASKLLANMVYNYKGMGLSMGCMIAGYDKKGPGLYYIDSDGTRTPGNVFSVGSGSTFAYGILDSGYRYDLTDDEAYDLGRRAIYHATHRDAYSGGIVRVYHIKPEGYKIISEEDCKILYDRYQEEKMQ